MSVASPSLLVGVSLITAGVTSTLLIGRLRLCLLHGFHRAHPGEPRFGAEDPIRMPRPTSVREEASAREPPTNDLAKVIGYTEDLSPPGGDREMLECRATPTCPET